MFDKQNKFSISDLLLEMHNYSGAELNQGTKIYNVIDSIILKQRVGLVSGFPIIMIVHAIRNEVKPNFDKPPIQSDYTSTYESLEELSKTHQSSILKLFIKKIFFKLSKKIQFLIEGQIHLKIQHLTWN